jgi:hypothetical protein
MDFGTVKEQESTRLLLVTLIAIFTQQLQRTSCRIGRDNQFGAALGWNIAILA